MKVKQFLLLSLLISVSLINIYQDNTTLNPEFQIYHFQNKILPIDTYYKFQSNFVHPQIFPDLGFVIAEPIYDLKWIKDLPDFFNSKLHLDNPIELQQNQRLNLKSSTNVRREAEMLGIDDFWQNNFTGNGVVIAVLDSGVDFSHPSLTENEYRSISFVNTSLGYSANQDAIDRLGHGTKVASLITGSGSGSDSPKLQGMANRSLIYNMKVADNSGVITLLGLLTAIDYASSIPEVDVINLSLGGLDETANDDLVEQAVNNAVLNGKIVVVSAGNEGSFLKDPYTVKSPGSARNVITVGAVDYNYFQLYFSSEGPTQANLVKPDIYSFGSYVDVANIFGNGYIRSSGTSFSTPIITGVVALVVEFLNKNNLRLSSGDVKTLIVDSVKYPVKLPVLNATLLYDRLLQLNQSKLSYELQENVIPESSKIPQGESISFPITIFSAFDDSWSISIENSTFGHLINISELSLPSTDVRTLTINTQNAALGKYSGEIIFSSSIVTRVINLSFSVIEPAKYRFLLDLRHTSMDSFFGSNRLLGKAFSWLNEIMNDQNIWVEESISILSDELLDGYDGILMLDAFFVASNPSFIVNSFPEVAVTSSELNVLHKFISLGGDLFIDFSGSSPEDRFFEDTMIDYDSLTKVLAILGIEISSIDLTNNYANTTIVDDSRFNQTSFNTGLTELRGGVSIGYTSEYVQSIVGTSTVSGSDSLVINSRIWRDPSVSRTLPAEFISSVFNQMVFNQNMDYRIEIVDPVQFQLSIKSQNSINLLEITEDYSVVQNLTDELILSIPLKGREQLVGLELKSSTEILKLQVLLNNVTTFSNFQLEDNKENNVVVNFVLNNVTNFAKEQLFAYSKTEPLEHQIYWNQLNEDQLYITMEITEQNIDQLVLIYRPDSIDYTVVGFYDLSSEFSTTSSSGSTTTSSTRVINSFLLKITVLLLLGICYRSIKRISKHN